METYKEYCRRNNIVPNEELVSIDKLEVPDSLKPSQESIEYREFLIRVIKTNMQSGKSFTSVINAMNNGLDANIANEKNWFPHKCINEKALLNTISEDECVA